MTDRLAELRRQRSLISAHLAWLDREIGQMEAPPSHPPLPLRSPSDTAIPSSPLPEGQVAVSVSSPAAGSPPAAEITVRTPIGVAEPEILLEKFRSPPGALNRDVRQGCILYFVGALVLLGIGIAILYFTIGSR